MRKQFKYISLTIIILISGLNNIKAQYSYAYPFGKGWDAGLNLGLSYFYGDVNDNKGRFWKATPLSGFYYEEKNLTGDLSLGKIINPYLHLRSHFVFGKISGSNDELNTYFNGNIMTFGLDVHFHYIDFFMKRPESSKFKYYSVTGLGFTSYNAVRREISTNKFLSSVGYSNYGNNKTSNNSSASLKLGLGVAYHIDRYWKVNFESSLNYLFTDKLDGLVSSNTLLEGYGLMSFGVAYKFDLNIKTHNNNWKKSSGTNNRPHNSGFENKRKRKLHNKWKR